MVDKKKVRNELLPDIGKRMSLNRFFASERDIINDELEAVVPEAVEDALENPTGTYQRTTNKLLYRLNTINRNTKDIKKDVSYIREYLDKDLRRMLNGLGEELQSQGSSGFLGTLGDVLTGLVGGGAAGAAVRGKGGGGRGAGKGGAKPGGPGRLTQMFRSTSSAIKTTGANVSGAWQTATGAGAKGVPKGVMKVAEKGGFSLKSNIITTTALTIYTAWWNISSLDKPPVVSRDEYRKNVEKELIAAVASGGLYMVGSAIAGFIAGTIAPGVGNLAGFLIGMTGGMIADWWFGDDLEKAVKSDTFIELVDSVVTFFIGSDETAEKNKKKVDDAAKKIIRNAAANDPYAKLTDAELAAKGIKRAGTQAMGRAGVANLYERIEGGQTIPQAVSGAAGGVVAGGAVAGGAPAAGVGPGGMPVPQSGQPTPNASSAPGASAPGTPMSASSSSGPAGQAGAPTATPVGTFSGTADAVAARKNAETYLGRPMSDQEYDYLIRATHAEAAAGKKADPREQGMIMASILNRARDKGENGVIAALEEKNQFQSVTGTRYEPGPSANFSQGPGQERLTSIQNSTAMLQAVPHDQKNFTAASAAAYGPGTNIGYRDKMLANGGTVIGGSVFNTTPNLPNAPAPTATPQGTPGPNGRYDAAYYESFLKPHDLHAKTRENSITGLDMEMKARLGAMFRDAPDYVKKELKIQSAFRDQATQDALKAKAGSSPYVAKKSQHTQGKAVDLGSGKGSAAQSWASLSPETQQWVLANSEKYGLYRPMQPGKTSITEDWHFEPIGNRSGKPNQPTAKMSDWIDPAYTVSAPTQMASATPTGAAGPGFGPTQAPSSRPETQDQRMYDAVNWPNQTRPAAPVMQYNPEYPEGRGQAAPVPVAPAPSRYVPPMMQDIPTVEQMSGQLQAMMDQMIARTSPQITPTQTAINVLPQQSRSAMPLAAIRQNAQALGLNLPSIGGDNIFGAAAMTLAGETGLLQ